MDELKVMGLLLEFRVKVKLRGRYEEELVRVRDRVQMMVVGSVEIRLTKAL